MTQHHEFTKYRRFEHITLMHCAENKRNEHYIKEHQHLEQAQQKKTPKPMS